MELKDTVDLMLSSSPVDRLRAEYFQLAIRIEKLENMLAEWDQGKLAFKPACPRVTYEMQLMAMKEYKAVLESRAKMEGAALDKGGNWHE